MYSLMLFSEPLAIFDRLMRDTSLDFVRRRAAHHVERMRRDNVFLCIVDDRDNTIVDVLIDKGLEDDWDRVWDERLAEEQQCCTTR